MLIDIVIFQDGGLGLKCFPNSWDIPHLANVLQSTFWGVLIYVRPLAVQVRELICGEGGEFLKVTQLVTCREGPGI